MLPHVSFYFYSSFSVIIQLPIPLAQVAMDELNGHRPFTDAGGDTLDGTMLHISGCENTWDNCFQEERFTIRRPALKRLSLVHQVQTGEDEALLVASTTPFSQLVCGSAPMKMNSEVAGTVCSSCVLSLTHESILTNPSQSPVSQHHTPPPATIPAPEQYGGNPHTPVRR